MTSPLAENSVAPVGARRIQFRWWWLLVLVAGLVALFAVTRLVNSSPKTVSRVTFVNNSSYDIATSVTDGSNNDTMELGTAKARTSTDFNDVVDQGGTWVFHFTGLGGDAGDVTVSRVNLARQQWRVVIPDNVIQRIAAADEATSPTTPSGH